MESERKHLQSLVQLYRDSIPYASKTHIQSVPIEGNKAAKEFAQKIVEEGFDVRPLMSPTVQRRKEVLRICLHAFNTINELKRLLDLIDSHKRSMK
jgi:8-amino-7-oxononanoate synthase